MIEVSIVIPAYNAAKTLAEAVASLQAQTFVGWEAIIVDDGSTDDTLSIAKRLSAAEPRLRVISQSNRGVSAARNVGIERARAEWLLFLDADDWLLPTCLGRMLECVAADRHLDVVHCGHYLVTNDGQRGPGLFTWWTKNLFDELARRNPFATHTCLVRRALVQEVGQFDTRLTTAEDWDLWQRIARAGARFVALPEVLACYRRHPGTASSNIQLMAAESLIVIERGHQSDPRVPHPDPAYAQGIPPEQAPLAKLYLVCWMAGLAIGQGEDARPLLNSVPAEGNLNVSAELVAAFLFDAIPWAAGQVSPTWHALWPKVETHVAWFLAMLEHQAATPGLAEQATQRLLALGNLTGTNGSKVQPELKPPADSQRDANSEDSPTDMAARVAELEEARLWLEQQVSNWKSASAERDHQILELKGWIEELERGKAWVEAQWQIWQRLAEERETRLQQLTGGPLWMQPRKLIARWRARGSATSGKSPELPAFAQPPVVQTEAPPQVPALETKPEAAFELFAEPRRLEPFSRNWGYERGYPIDRYYIESFLERHAADVQGRVLEIGDNTYTRRFGADRVTQSDVLHVIAGHPGATIVADLTQADHVPSETFDCIILTQTFQLIYDTPTVLRTLWRILKPGGVLLATCPGITRISQIEWKDSWYWRFTLASLRRLLDSTGPWSAVDCASHGNVLVAGAFLYGLVLEDLSSEELDYHDPDYDVILTLRAVKPASEAAPPSVSFRQANSQTQIAPQQTAKALILTYHRIAEAQVDPWILAVTPEHFAQQLQVLNQNCHPARLHKLLPDLSQDLGRRPQVVITFDDGYADNLHQALPLLEQHGIPATFFITTGLSGAQAEFWWDTLERIWLWPGTLPASLRLSVAGRSVEWRLDEWAVYPNTAWEDHRQWRAWHPPPTPRHAAFVELWELLHPLPPEVVVSVMAALQAWAKPAAEPQHRRLSLEELQRLAHSELADFGGHTVTHPSLATLPLAAQRAEIEECQRWLAEAVGGPVRSFSYPFGKPADFGPETVSLVRAAGIGQACTNTAGLVDATTDSFQLPRLHVQDWDGAEFERELWRWLG